MVKYSTEYDIRGEFMYQNINESTKTIRDTWEFENTSIDVIKFEDEKERFPVLINNIKKIYSSCSSCLHHGWCRPRWQRSSGSRPECGWSGWICPRWGGR